MSLPSRRNKDMITLVSISYYRIPVPSIHFYEDFARYSEPTVLEYFKEILLRYSMNIMTVVYSNVIKIYITMHVVH